MRYRQRKRDKKKKLLEKSSIAFPENPESIQYFPTMEVNIRKQQPVLLHMCVYIQQLCGK